MAKNEAREFSVIAVRCDGSVDDPAVEQFAEAFSLDREAAGQILDAAPIVVQVGLTKSDVKSLTPKLTELSTTGIEFRVTARDVRGLPQVTDPGGVGQPPTFNLANRAFACPSCGEAFLFQAQADLKLGDPA